MECALISSRSDIRPSHREEVLNRDYRAPSYILNRPFALPGENRARPRLQFDCTIRWNDGGVDRLGTARDASEIGVGFTVRSICRPHVGQAIRLVFELDDGYEWMVDDRAVVTRCDLRPDGLCDVGVRLRHIEI